VPSGWSVPLQPPAPPDELDPLDDASLDEALADVLEAEVDDALDALDEALADVLEALDEALEALADVLEAEVDDALPGGRGDRGR